MIEGLGQGSSNRQESQSPQRAYCFYKRTSYESYPSKDY